MYDNLDMVAWSATLLGLFAIAVAIGALRSPGKWAKMVEEIEKSPALQLLSGFIELFVGAAVYLLSPWDPADILSIVMKIMGGMMMLEALVVMAISDLYFQTWLKNLAAMRRGWPLVTLVIGVVLAGAGMLRFG
ncbi:hypothetical protein P7228_09470 [Altererythrobacter arenosus]|uniref:DUF2065 family protein n=1 Tax=Altererythrobacter arenosus TaxID=3032592 RepID=A0ABY8FMH4_9SPHN|nr:hypothetical protein [Altererythrobacter sp. CAU 1644]WFL76227.1 hypothetical protein P7228_09470 [Altererythrobacter sp. CAU 1644]